MEEEGVSIEYCVGEVSGKCSQDYLLCALSFHLKWLTAILVSQALSKFSLPPPPPALGTLTADPSLPFTSVCYLQVFVHQFCVLPKPQSTPAACLALRLLTIHRQHLLQRLNPTFGRFPFQYHWPGTTPSSSQQRAAVFMWLSQQWLCMVQGAALISLELGRAGDGGTKHKDEKEGRRAQTCSGSGLPPSPWRLCSTLRSRQMWLTHLKFNFDTIPQAEIVVSSSTILWNLELRGESINTPFHLVMGHWNILWLY